MLIKGSPPLTRGILTFCRDGGTTEGITPAYAGNTIIAIFFHDTARDHPRLRGEYKNERTEPGAGTGSPPLTRGILPFSFRTPAIVGITPAYAGNTVHSNQSTPGNQDHPRLRGEYSVDGAVPGDETGSPPLTRGILASSVNEVYESRITPAYAGNTLKESLIYSIFPLSATKFHLVSHTLEMS